MGFPRGKGRDTGFTRDCAAAELPVTQSALSALQMVSLGLFSQHLINPSDSLILQSRNAFPPDRLLPSQGAEHPQERGAGGGTVPGSEAAGSAGLPGSQAGLPVCSARQPPGFRHSLIRTFLWAQHRNQLFPLPAERDGMDNLPAGASSPRAGGTWEGDCCRHSGAEGAGVGGKPHTVAGV